MIEVLGPADPEGDAAGATIHAPLLLYIDVHAFNKWDLRRRREVHCVEDPHGGAEVHAVVAGARERAEFATAAADAVVKIWHVDDEGRREMMKGELVGHTDHVTALEWCEWRALWITASDDHTIRLWRADTRASIRCVSVRTEGEGVTTMTLDPCASVSSPRGGT